VTNGIQVSDVAVRRADPSDARSIAGVHVRTWRRAYRGIVPDRVLDSLSVDARTRNWREWLGDPEGRSTTFVAEGAGGAVEGFCSVNLPSRDEDADEQTAEVSALYVEPGRWRTGLGTALLEAALADARERGAGEATLWVFARNEGARAFYARFGFEPDGGERRHDWSGGETEVRLRSGKPLWRLGNAHTG
jgi:GNAT superfamily N-acetyltransferase